LIVKPITLQPKKLLVNFGQASKQEMALLRLDTFYGVFRVTSWVTDVGHKRKRV